MRILAIENDPYNPLGMVEEVINGRGGNVTTVRPGAGEVSRLVAAEYDALVILGGPQHANDDEGFPVIPAVLDLIRTFHVDQKPTLGLCLGAQMIARALGGRVFVNDFLEFGYIPVDLCSDAHQDPLLNGLGSPQLVFSWHQDSFDLPPDAVPLWQGRQCLNQAFRAGRATYAFQSHLEITPDVFECWLQRQSADLVDSFDEAERRARIDLCRRQLAENWESASSTAVTIIERWCRLASA